MLLDCEASFIERAGGGVRPVRLAVGWDEFCGPLYGMSTPCLMPWVAPVGKREDTSAQAGRKGSLQLRSSA